MTELESALTSLDAAERRYYAAEALAEISALPGLRWAWLDPEQIKAVVTLDGRKLGQIWPQRPGQMLTGWSAYGLDGERLPGEFHTPRHAAAALAETSAN